MNSQSPVSPYHFPAKSSAPDAVLGNFSDAQIILFYLLHIPLGLLVKSNENIATAYALFVLAAGIIWVISKRTPQHFAYLAAYIAGAEVVWRMSEANVFWEYGKYATVLVMLIGLFSLRHEKSKLNTLPVLYFLLLLPSIILTITGLSLNESREEISFNLSGPLSLMMCAIFFNGTKMSRAQLGNLIVAFTLPVLSMATIIFDTIRRAGFNIIFTDASNMVTSGGYGPNQVSAVLGLAVFLIVVFLLLTLKRPSLRAFLFLLLVVFATESILTFSRSGVYLAAGSSIAVAVLFTPSKQRRIQNALLSLVIFGIAYFWIFPFINGFTGGTALERYKDINLTNRDLLMREDLRLFQENPIIGVGPGMAIYFRTSSLRMIAAHTEFTRALAEHGIFGLASIFCLLLFGIVRFIRAGNNITRALVAGFFLWTLLFMAVNGMRIVAPSLLIGLAAVEYVDLTRETLPEKPSYYGFGNWKRKS